MSDPTEIDPKDIETRPDNETRPDKPKAEKMEKSKFSELAPGDEVKEHLKSRHTWLRVIYMVLFAFVLYVSKFVLLATALLQMIAALLTGKPNERLTRFGGSLSKFIYEIACFLTFNSDDMPFPFAEWPNSKRLPKSGD